MRRTIAVIGILLVIVLTAPRAAAQSPTPSPAGEPELAAEELALRLLAYLLPAAGLPPGYRGVAGVEVETPASEALQETPPGGDPWPRFAVLARTLRLELHQQLIPAEANVPATSFTVSLFVDADAATAAIEVANRPDPAATRLDIGVSLGEAGAVWRWSLQPPGQPEREVHEVRWRRGPFAYEVQAIAAPGTFDLTLMLATATWADAHVAVQPFPDLTPTITSPGSEAERLTAMVQLRTLGVRGLRASELPAGFRPFASVDIRHPADNLLVAAVFTPGADAQQLLEQSAMTMRRLAYGGWGFVRVPASGSPGPASPELFLVVGVDADADAAARDLVDPVQSAYTLSRLSGIDPTAPVATPPPVQLGEDTAFWVIPLPPRQAGGPAGENLVLRWRHGQVVLSAQSVGPAGTVTVEELVQAAQALEAAYAASELTTLDAPKGAAAASAAAGGDDGGGSVLPWLLGGGAALVLGGTAGVLYLLRRVNPPRPASQA